MRHQSESAVTAVVQASGACVTGLNRKWPWFSCVLEGGTGSLVSKGTGSVTRWYEREWWNMRSCNDGSLRDRKTCDGLVEHETGSERHME